MLRYNLYKLIHREFDWSMVLPDGTIKSGKGIREITIRIPKIQRDYAEGRETETIERKRRNLLNDIIDVVYGVRTDLSFDFVYGYLMSNGHIVTGNEWQNLQKCPNVAFEPLDGQQRLTTLFLLYWLLGRAADLRDKNSHSLFIYETRDTSEEFCHWLVKQDIQIITDWKQEVASIKKQNSQNQSKWETAKDANGIIDPIANRLLYPLAQIPSLFQYMQSLDSFKWEWHDDPNIHSMITVLESTIGIINERGLQYTVGVANSANLNNVTFMLLDELVCDGDQLFEKMNARGKALTSFEILKSSLEEEMEQQGLPTINPVLADDWRNAMDGQWIDYCWDNTNIGDKPQLKTVKTVEEKLERLMIRMIGKSFFATNITGTQIAPSPDSKDFTALFAESVTKSECANMVLSRYLEYARHERAVNGSFSALDFQSIYTDIQNLLYQDTNAKWREASSMLPQITSSNTRTLMEMFMDDKITHNTRVMVYAMFAYLRIVSASTIIADVSGTEKANFIDWMRFMRNVYNADNKNSGLDNFGDVQTAISAIDKWLDEYKNKYRANGKQDILHLIANHIKDNPHGQEQARLEEEAIKANLRINGSNGIAASAWETSLFKAENNFYLWGQIIAPLSWSSNGTSYDKTSFDNYVNRLEQIFTCPICEDKPVDALLIQAMLCRQDYRHNLRNELGSLGRLNKNRDYSWKQYLRKKDATTGYYGSLFKELMDSWNLPTFANLSFEDFLKQEIATHKSTYGKTDWQYYIVNFSDPKSLLQIFSDIHTYGRYIYTPNNNHSFYFRSDTFRTYYRYELLTIYLRYETRLLAGGVSTSNLTPTADTRGAHVDFTLPNRDVIRLSLGSPSLYNIERMSPAYCLLFQDIDILTVEKELVNLGVITSL